MRERERKGGGGRRGVEVSRGAGMRGKKEEKRKCRGIKRKRNKEKVRERETTPLFH